MIEETKKASIVCDNYKLEEFEKGLSLNGFTKYKVLDFTQDTKSICVTLPANRMNELAVLVKKINDKFKKS